MVLRKNNKGEAEASPCVVHDEFLLEEIPRAEPVGIQRAFSVIYCATSTRCRIVVCVSRIDAIPLNTKPYGRVDIIGQVDDVLPIRL